MRHIRNFIHNINDIVLALVIVAVAAGVIYWRMDIILDYPKQIAAQNAVYMQDDDVDGTEDADAEAADAEDGSEAEDADAGDAGAADDADTEADTEADAEEAAGAKG